MPRGFLPGMNVVSVLDENNCEEELQVQIAEPLALQADVSVEPVTCDGEPGSIEITTEPNTGVGPYAFALGTEGAYTDSPYFEGLSEGNYELLVIDANDCMLQLEAEVPNAPPPIEVNISDQVNLIWGESASLEASLIYANGNVNVQWSPQDETISCSDCLTPTFTPSLSTNYLVEIVDELGCTWDTLLQVLVDKPRRVYIPNAFSPNDDGNNDLFYPFGGSEVVEILNMQMFDRWGELVFDAQNFPPEDPQFGWDGYFNGEPAAPGIYVYLIEVRFTDGLEELYQGEVLLMR